MNTHEMSHLFVQYVNGWKTSNKRLILSVCDPLCEITECYGPKYHGIGQIERWIIDWISKNHRVSQWDILGSFFDLPARTAVFEWTFACYSDHRDHYFKGCSIVQFNQMYITRIKEFRMEPEQYYPFK
ncbi:hypothetical protein ABNN70_09070 [Sporolactobacillus sp. Y61]|uniref:Nuclear transport factor 2 family protein n=1 Tax=Sporolactobacillus sp. Y61 TaxID=3160863 RepID=A0AAU8ICE0_9BACL